MKVNDSKKLDVQAASSVTREITQILNSPTSAEIGKYERDQLLGYMLQPQKILELPGFIELKEVLVIVPIGRSKWYEGQKLGVYPKPVPLGIGRRRAYRRSDIKALVQRLEAGHG